MREVFIRLSKEKNIIGCNRMTVKTKKGNCRWMEGNIFRLRELIHPVEQSAKENSGDLIARDTYRHKEVEKQMI